MPPAKKKQVQFPGLQICRRVDENRENENIPDPKDCSGANISPLLAMCPSFDFHAVPCSCLYTEPFTCAISPCNRYDSSPRNCVFHVPHVLTWKIPRMHESMLESQNGSHNTGKMKNCDHALLLSNKLAFVVSLGVCETMWLQNFVIIEDVRVLNRV